MTICYGSGLKAGSDSGGRDACGKGGGGGGRGGPKG